MAVPHPTGLGCSITCNTSTLLPAPSAGPFFYLPMVPTKPSDQEAFLANLPLTTTKCYTPEWKLKI
jgi:hypothetical protein